MKKRLQIAIDGPAAAGKGTISSGIAKKIGILYVYTGAMYRAVALLAIRRKVDLQDEEKIISLLKGNKIVLRKAQKNSVYGYSIFLNDEDVTEEIRTPQVDWGASVVGTLPRVRKVLVEQQQQIAREQSVIMEGRDITTKVLPTADLKIYLTADQKERVRRRKRQLEKEQGLKKSMEEVMQEIRRRDYQDSHRKADPLTIGKDAWILDTTNLTIDQVVKKILEKLKEKELT